MKYFLFKMFIHDQRSRACNEYFSIKIKIYISKIILLNIKIYFGIN